MRSVRAATPPFVLLNESPPAGRGGSERSYLFEDPVELLTCEDAATLPRFLAEVSRAPSRGLYAAGYLAYELGYLLEPRLSGLLARRAPAPLAWMGLYRERRVLDAAATEQFLDEAASPGATSPGAASWEPTSPDAPSPEVRLHGVRASKDEREFAGDIRRILAYIAAGETYQINYTIRLHAEVQGSPIRLFSLLRHRQRTQFSALVATGEDTLLSLSPELFFRKTAGTVELRPMKGTCRRGRDAAEDAALARFLRSDEKSRAENVMIVDLLRSDIGRLATPGSVKVSDLFAVEPYESVLQMTSTIRAQVDAGTPFEALIRSLFPCGSVTGAPKIRTMQLIAELEDEPRGAYTGAIGFLTPDNDACFNVAIRTITVKPSGHAVLGVGGGVLSDSDPAAEYEECRLKAAFFTALAS